LPIRIRGREPQRTWHQEELTDGKPPVLKSNSNSELKLEVGSWKPVSSARQLPAEASGQSMRLP
jgi:hypothetical protein